ncbi:hypothetical protein KC19_VG194300, partial [Ceratodon purpureus]
MKIIYKNEAEQDVMPKFLTVLSVYIHLRKTNAHQEVTQLRTSLPMVICPTMIMLISLERSHLLGLLQFLSPYFLLAFFDTLENSTPRPHSVSLSETEILSAAKCSSEPIVLASPIPISL